MTPAAGPSAEAPSPKGLTVPEDWKWLDKYADRDWVEVEVAAIRELQAAAREAERLREAAEDAWNTLDRALGDSDIDWHESEDEMREQEPVQWAAMTLARALRQEGKG